MLIEINRNPPHRELRKFGLLWFPLFCGVLGAVLYHRVGWLPLSIGIWCLAAPAMVLGAVSPRHVLPIYRGLMTITFPIGFVVSHVLMALIYYGVFTPIGVLMRLAGKDPLRLKRSRGADSHWLDRPEETDETEQYFRQF